MFEEQSVGLTFPDRSACKRKCARFSSHTDVSGHRVPGTDVDGMACSEARQSAADWRTSLWLVDPTAESFAPVGLVQALSRRGLDRFAGWMKQDSEYHQSRSGGTGRGSYP